MKLTEVFYILVLLMFSLPAFAAGINIVPAAGRSVMQRGELFEVAVHVQLPEDAQNVTLDFWMENAHKRTHIGGETIASASREGFHAFYSIDTGKLALGEGRLRVRLNADGQVSEAECPLEIVTDVPRTDFKIHNLAFLPEWVQPTGNVPADLRAYHFNYSATQTADFFERPSTHSLSASEVLAEQLTRYGIDYLKYPTVFGWGLAHRPIGEGVSWFDPAAREWAAQLVQYTTQACRRFPVFVGMNPMDEPGVPWYDRYMVDAFENKTELRGPSEDETPAKFRQRNLAVYREYQVFRNSAIQDFNAEVKHYVKEVMPEAQYTLQTCLDIMTDAGLYPSLNLFQDVQCTHIYDHFPTSNNWMLFDVNFRRANRKAFWKMPLYVATGCCGIMEDQWRAAWAFAISEKVEGHGYFLGAGELDEKNPWSEFSLAEMVRLNRINERYGNFFLSLEKPVEPLALWYSLAQAAAADPERQYEQELVGAFFALKRAHFPVTIITDEDIRNGLLSEHKVLMLVGIEETLPGDLRAAVTHFAKAGGKAVCDRTTTIRLPNAVRMEVDFREFAANWKEVGRAWDTSTETSMQLRRDLFAEASILRNLDKVKAALNRLVKKPVDAESPFTILSVQRSGNANYVFVVNDASVFLHPNDKERWITMQESVPATDWISLPIAKDRVVYDLWSGRRLKVKDGEIKLRLPAASLQVLCIFPEEIPNLVLDVQLQQSTHQSIIAVDVKKERGGKANSGVIPGHVCIEDPCGQVVFERSVAIGLSKGAANSWVYTFGANDLTGKWKITLENLLTRKKVGKIVVVQPTHISRRDIVRALPSVRVFDERMYPGFIKRQDLLIVPGTGCEEEALFLANALQAKVRRCEEVRKDDTIPESLAPTPGRYILQLPKPLSLTVGANLILLGTPENNLLLRDLNESGMLPWQMSETLLGSGQGLIEYVWSPFDLNKDAVLLCGYDKGGLQAACERFLQVSRIHAGGKSAGSRSLPREDTLEGGTSTKCSTCKNFYDVILAKALLTDSVRKIARAPGLIAVGGEDSRVTVFDEDLSERWHRDFDYRVTGLSLSETGDLLAVSAFPRTYLFDRAGNLLCFLAAPTPSREDIEGLAIIRDFQSNQSPWPALITGSWLGEVKAYDKNGNRLWIFPKAEAIAQQSGIESQSLNGAIRSITQLENGNFVVACMLPANAEEHPKGGPLVVVTPAGKEIVRKELDRIHVVEALGGKVAAASFKRKLYLLDDQLNLLWEKETPHFIMDLAVAPEASRIAVALFNGQVLLYSAEGELVKQVRIPSEAIFTSIAVDEKGESAWIGTWEGEILKVKLR